MKREKILRSLWLDAGLSTQTRIVLYVGVAIFVPGLMLFLFVALSGALDGGLWGNLWVIVLFSLPLDYAIVWIVFSALMAARRARRRRARFPRLLQQALSAHGQSGEDFCGGEFPDVPIHVSGDWIYYAGDSGVDAQPLEQLVWAYGESIRGKPWHQIVIWDRSANGTVLPLRKHDMAPALARIGRAAPWLPVGYNAAMKESWNADHHDFLALVEAHRKAGQAFDVSWAGKEVALVTLFSKDDVIQTNLNAREKREQKKLTERWDREARS